MTADPGARARRVRLLILDVDGVLTDGRLYFLPDGGEMKVFHVRDGLGIRRVLEAGVEVAVISGRESPVVARRMADLGVRHVFQGSDDKLGVFRELLGRLGLRAEETAYVGDDVIDLAVMERVGLPLAVRDAHPDVLAAAAWVTALDGGRGAVREVCDLLLGARDG